MPSIRPRNLSILTLMVAFFVAPMSGAALALLAIATFGTSTVAERLGTELMAHASQGAAREVDSMLEAIERQCLQAAAHVESKRDGWTLERLWPELLAQQRAFETSQATTLAFADGSGVSVRHMNDAYFVTIAEEGTVRTWRVGDDGSLVEPPIGEIAGDLRRHPWYGGARERGTGWTDPAQSHCTVNQELVLATGFAVPVAGVAGRPEGVAFVELWLADLSRALLDMPFVYNGQLMLVDGHGRLLAASRQALLTGEGARRSLAGLRWPNIEILDERCAAHLASDVSRPTLELDGERVRAMTVRSATAGGLEWVLIAVLPESRFLNGAWNVRRQLFVLSAITVMVAGLIVWRVAAGVTRPVVALREHMRAIGDGDLEHRIELHASRELVELTDDLNRMTEALRDRVSLRNSVSVASEVQRALLPGCEMRRPGIEVHGQSRYCEFTGGDYFDFIDVVPLGDRASLIAIGDVMGHGVAAALLMATTRSALRAEALQTGSLNVMMNTVNRVLVQSHGDCWFVNLFLLLLEDHGRSIRWASAGATMALLHDPDTGTLTELGGGDIPLGIDGATEYQEYRIEGLRPGMTILLATDGIWEAIDAQGEQLGEDQVRRVLTGLAGRSAQEIADAITQSVAAHHGEIPPADDETFVVIRITDDVTCDAASDSLGRASAAAAEAARWKAAVA